MTKMKNIMMLGRNISAWKIIAVKEWKKQLNAKNKHINWCSIVKKLDACCPGWNGDAKDKNNKIKDFIRKSPAVEIILNELDCNVTLQELVEAAGGTVTKKGQNTLTTAHINDEDSDQETENETVSLQPQTVYVESKINKDGTRTEVVDFNNEELTRDELLNETTLLLKLGYDPSIWEIVSSSCRTGQWEQATAEGEVRTLYSYRVNANVKKREGSICEDYLVEAFKKQLENHDRPQYKRIEPVGENMAILSIADLHLGKLAWAKEVGESYDYKICRDRFFYIINKSITALKKVENLEKIVFFWSQDFFHYDNLHVTTTAGTPQDTDIRWQKLYEVGCTMLVDAIELLQNELEVPIMTFYTRSNHDRQVSFYALNYLYAWFHDNPNVEVNRDPIGRKYVEYGVNLMGFGHGDEEKKRIHNVMQIEQKEAWARTINHEWFLGHFHKLMVNDECGVRATYLSSATGTDAWHYDQGFIGAFKQVQIFIRNKYEGPAGTIDINILD